MNNRSAWTCVGVLGATMIACSPESLPPGSEEGSSTGPVADGDFSGPTGESTAEPPGTTEDGTTSDGTTGDGTTGDGTTEGAPVDECPPRSFEDDGSWAFFDADSRDPALYDAQTQCTFVQQLEPVVPGTLELELSCAPIDDVPSQLFVRIWAEVEALPFAPGDPLQLTNVVEPDGAINQQTLMTLRDPEGELLLAGFQGYEPQGKGPESAMFFDPLSMALLDVGCLVPCEDLGCYTRAAIDVSIGAETTRIYDGSAATVGEQPSYYVHVGYATLGSAGLDDWGQHAGLVIVRQP